MSTPAKPGKDDLLAQTYLVNALDFGHTKGMTKRLILLLAFLLAISARCESLQLDTLKVGSTTYSNVTILGANATDLYFKHSLGLANVKLKYAPPELQKRFEYNPKVAAEAEKRRSEDDLRYESSIVNTGVAQEDKATPPKRLGSLGADTGLADPVSETSPLGKASPKLDVDKWLGDKPVLEGKFVLIAFWAPWSAPCRQWIPELNALQKKFADKLVVVGICAGPEAAISEMPDPHADFVLGIDSKSKLSGAAGVTSIPCLLLCDPKGIVLYQGHPGAITEKKLQAIMANMANGSG
jgi:cytochrome c biogenesis protein CcmG/thiol:disulfide interchange protein DsbE